MLRKLLLPVFLAGCGGTQVQPAPPPTLCETLELDYRSFGAPFMRDWCTGCHSSDLTGDARAGAPADVNFDTRDGVLMHLDRIQARAAASPPTMPPRGQPGPEERSLLADWISCGAP
jgi:hypothetical protein